MLFSCLSKGNYQEPELFLAVHLLLQQNLVIPFGVMSGVLFGNCVDIYRIRRAIFSNPFALTATVVHSQEKCRLF